MRKYYRLGQAEKLKLSRCQQKRKTKNRGVDLSKYQWESDPVSLAKRKDIDIFVELIGGHTGAAKTPLLQPLILIKT